MNKDTRIITLAFLIILLTSLVFAEKIEYASKEKPMSKEEQLQQHKNMGMAYFNGSWELLDKPDRTKDEEDVLIDMVHASLFHWRQLELPINILRGEQMITHVYTLLKHKEESLYHANNTLDWAKRAKADDWDLAYAYLAMARAQALNGNKEEFSKYFNMALEAGENIKEDGDREQFDADMNDKNWFGMK